MKKLINGISEFRNSDYKIHQKLFASLKDSQAPDTLFIGCSDSRVVPHMITQTLPGDLFVLRNIANIVPPFDKAQEYSATASAIEYAVVMLGVTKIIVCGHSDCGGCKALHYPSGKLDKVPGIQKWLTLAAPVKEKVLSLDDETSEESRTKLTEQINVMEQVNNLQTYPFIRERCKTDILTISGWYYVIGTGEVFIYNEEIGKFIPAG